MVRNLSDEAAPTQPVADKNMLHEIDAITSQILAAIQKSQVRYMCAFVNATCVRSNAARNRRYHLADPGGHTKEPICVRS
jgi:hypothetical protein